MNKDELELVKEFILWAKKHGIEQIKYADVAVVFSSQAMLDQLVSTEAPVELSSELSSAIKQSKSVESKNNELAKTDTAESTASQPESTKSNKESAINDDPFFSEEPEMPEGEDEDLYWSSGG